MKILAKRSFSHDRVRPPPRPDSPPDYAYRGDTQLITYVGKSARHRGQTDIVYQVVATIGRGSAGEQDDGANGNAHQAHFARNSLRIKI